MAKRFLTFAVAVALLAGFGTACASDSLGPDEQQMVPIDSEPLNEEGQGSDS